MTVPTRWIHYIFYGLGLALALFLLRWLELRLLIFANAEAIYAGAIALIFTVLGIWIALKITGGKKKVVVVEKPVLPPPR